jgi:hypothetical protein
MKKLAMLLLVLALCVPAANAAAINLGTAGSFGVLAGSAVTNTGDTIINGDVGCFPAYSITGFPPGTINGIRHPSADAATGTAKGDLLAAYNAAAGAAGGVPGPGELGGATLLPGVYTYETAASWTAGNLTLDAAGDSSAQWIFQIGTTLITPGGANVVLINSAEANNVFWQVGTSATIGGTNSFAGNILALESISLGGGTALNGRSLARNAAVTISGPVDINVPDFVTAVPVPNKASAILVYKVTVADKPVVIDANFNTALFNYNTASTVKSSDSFKGYLVFDVNTVTLKTVYHADEANELVADNPNYTPTLILKGTDPKTGVKKSKWVLKDFDGVGIQRLITSDKKPKKYASLNWDVAGVPDANFSSWGNTFDKLTGTVLVKGSKVKVEVPKSPKGSGSFRHSISSSNVPFDGVVDGTAKLTLDVAKTQKANAAGLTVKAEADLLAK